MTEQLKSRAIIFRGGTFLHLREGERKETDLLVAGGTVDFISPGKSYPRAREKDISGAVIFQGLVDMHTHLRAPGSGQDETLETGVRAALRGGVTALCCMANTKPVNDAPEVTRWILDNARRIGGPRILPVSAITKGLAGSELVDFRAQKNAGARAFSDDGRPVLDAGIMRDALFHAAELGCPLISHCEDMDLARGGAMREGSVSKRLRVPGITSRSEENMVRRDLHLAEELGVPIHIAHVSTKESVEAIREAKRRGAKVTAETAPHYLCLTQEDCMGGNPDFKMNPPLGTKEDQAALLEGLQDGTLDVIATDHAPHSAARKARGFEKAPFGVIGMETLLPLLLSVLVDRGILTLEQTLAKITLRPREILSLEEEEDLVIVNLERKWLIQRHRLSSIGKNCPFHGFVVRGKPLYTIVGGRVFAHPS